MAVVTFLNPPSKNIFHKHFHSLSVTALPHTSFIKKKYSLKVPRFNADYCHKDIAVKHIFNMGLSSTLLYDQPEWLASLHVEGRAFSILSNKYLKKILSLMISA